MDSHSWLVSSAAASCTNSYIVSSSEISSSFWPYLGNDGSRRHFTCVSRSLELSSRFFSLHIFFQMREAETINARSKP